MKQLVFIRHAKSSWRDPALTDLMRPLKKRGINDAREMAERIAQHDIRVDRVLMSPARRTVETLELMTDKTGFGRDIAEIVPDLYTFSYEDILLYLKTVDDGCTKLAVVGHNPAITDVVNFLCLEEIRNVPTCGVAVLDLDIDSWSQLRAGAAELAFYDYPKNDLSVAEIDRET